MLYCDTVFMRGSGLGTRLFTWGRCVLYAHAHDVPMLSSRWVQPRIGPWLRGGIDRHAYVRQILLAGLFTSAPGEIEGIHAARLRATVQRLAEPDDWRLNPYAAEAGRNKTALVTFAGYKNGFQDLNGHDRFLRERLQSITQERWLRLVEHSSDPIIGINVRLGNDFRTAQSAQEYYARGAIKTPLSWFAASLQLIRAYAGYPAKAVVVSDGTKAALTPLLALENVCFLRPGCAISDLLVLAKSKVLIASGGSSFSAWAAFLGQMPTISHPGQSLSWFKLANRLGNVVGEFDPDTPDTLFLEQAKTVLSMD